MEAASVVARWQVGKPIDESDFLLIRAKVPWNVATKTEGALWLLMDLCNELISRLQSDFQAYYNLGESDFMSLLPDAFERSAGCCTPEIVNSCFVRGGDWTFCLLHTLKYFIWGLAGLRHLDIEGLSDTEFRVRFEAEWQRLMGFRGKRYDFHVIPVLSYPHFLRYQALPHGDDFTRRTLSHYLVHQFCAYPHPIEAAAPRFREIAFGRRLREFYQPLLASTTIKAWRNLGLKPSMTREREDIQNEVNAAFDQFLNAFNFLAHRPAGWTGHGILGMNEDPDLQIFLDKIAASLGLSIRSTQLTEVPFAHYIAQKMKFWLEERYPRQTNEILTPNTNRLDGPDGQCYLTIEGAAREFGLSVDQLRRMDRSGSFPAMRAAEVWPTNCPCSPALRLYPDDCAHRQAAAIAASRAQTHSSALTGQELNRQQAALHLGISIKKLRLMEEKNQVQPLKRGRTVVYTQDTIETAQKILGN